MTTRFRGAALAGALLLLAAPGGAQSLVSLAGTEFKGSPPPIPIYECVNRLENRPYVPGEAQACLNEILSTGYFEDGKIRVVRRGDNTVSLIFALRAPVTIVKRLDFQANVLLEKIRQWLRMNPNNLHEGMSFELDADWSTRSGIERYFQSLGRAVGVTAVVRLDYREKAADVLYRITEGPPIPAGPILPPYGGLCDDLVWNQDWSQLDQNVPIPLVEKLAQLQALACFSKEALEADQKRLEDSGLFDDVKLTFSGPPQGRKVSLDLKVRRVPISSVNVRFYGLLGQEAAQERQDLPLKPGEVYLRPKAEETIKQLTESYAGSRRTVKVFEDEEVTPNKELRVYFHILAYEEDEAYVNSQRVYGHRKEIQPVPSHK
jgi:hypothetical protein